MIQALEKSSRRRGAVASTRGRVRSPTFSRSPHWIFTFCHRPETNVEKGNRLQILHKGNGQEVQDLDPQLVNSVSSLNIISALLEGLVSEDPHDLHPVPGVAERWEISADVKTYTFHLRNTAKWSNGDAVTSRDFVESYHRILAPASHRPWPTCSIRSPMRKRSTKERSTTLLRSVFARSTIGPLQIRLTNPTPYFLSLLNHYSWFPVHTATISKYGPLLERGSRWTKPGRFVGQLPRSHLKNGGP